ncbi:hypothetical protein [Mycolicibacterium brumae]|uniref:hypothetical protein n=1 Tax=Mycolicibacterium brumae TaxID=85968 RepID=UPI0034D399D7
MGPDGTPQVTAVWFLIDDDGSAAVSMTTDRQKGSGCARTTAVPTPPAHRRRAGLSRGFSRPGSSPKADL